MTPEHDALVADDAAVAMAGAPAQPAEAEYKAQVRELKDALEEMTHQRDDLLRDIDALCASRTDNMFSSGWVWGALRGRGASVGR